MRAVYHPKLVAASRELCKIRGVDPDQETKYHDQVRPVSRWMVVAEEIVSHLEIRKALMAVGLHGLDQVPASVTDEMSGYHTDGPFPGWTPPPEGVTADDGGLM